MVNVNLLDKLRKEFATNQGQGHCHQVAKTSSSEGTNICEQGIQTFGLSRVGIF